MAAGLISNAGDIPNHINETQTHILSMAAYPEDLISSKIFKLKLADRYKTGKQELDKALEDCANHPSTCAAPVKAYADMLDTVAHLRSPDKRTRANYIAAWVNLAITYDDDENSRLDTTPDFYSVYRSPLKTLADGQGVCVEQAELKLYALEKVYGPENVRVVLGEETPLALGTEAQNDLSDSDVIRVGNTYWTLKPHVYDLLGDYLNADGHAIATVRIGNTNWVLNNQTYSPSNEPIPGKNAARMVNYSGFMENDSQSVAPWSRISTGKAFDPNVAFNSNLITGYFYPSDSHGKRRYIVHTTPDGYRQKSFAFDINAPEGKPLRTAFLAHQRLDARQP